MMMAAISSGSIATTTTSTFNSQHGFSAATTLQMNRKTMRRLIIDLVVIVIIQIPIVVCEFGIEPYRRGFFCNDETIRYPLNKSTVTNVMLGLLVGLVPALIFVIAELIRYHRRGRMDSRIAFVCGCRFPAWLLECIYQIIFYGLGLALTFDATEVGKYTIGRLRPNFIAVCQPQIFDGTTCADEKNQLRYIEDYACRASGYTAADVLESRRSFPSGHSSLAFYSMVYICVYLQYRMIVRTSKLLRNFLQFLALMVAWFTALSRIMDNWHHWSDVLAGGLIGIVGAILTAHFIARLQSRSSVSHPHPHPHPHSQSQSHTNKDVANMTNLRPTLPRQDTSATLDVVITTPPPYALQHMDSFTNDQFTKV